MAHDWTASMSRAGRARSGPWIGYVPQDVELFDGTVLTTLRARRPDALVVAAGQRADTNDLAARGYDTEVMSMARSLGQRQRWPTRRMAEPCLVVLTAELETDGAGECTGPPSIVCARLASRPSSLTGPAPIARPQDPGCEGGRAERFAGSEVMKETQQQKRLVSTARSPPDTGANMDIDTTAGSGRHGRLLSRRGQIIVAGALVPIAAWIALAPLSMAVVAPAFVKVDLNRRPVQHLEGGIVRTVLVRDGQLVAAGDPVLIWRRRRRGRPQPPGLPRDGRAGRSGAPGRRAAARQRHRFFGRTAGHGAAGSARTPDAGQ
jgi:hypothetical protein